MIRKERLRDAIPHANAALQRPGDNRANGKLLISGLLIPVRGKRLFGCVPTHQFRTKIQIPRAIQMAEQAATMIVGVVCGSLKNMIVEAK
jgi:hypothetical protein